MWSLAVASIGRASEAALELGPSRRCLEAFDAGLVSRNAIEPVIGHLKAEHRMGRNHIWYRRTNAINAISSPPATISAAWSAVSGFCRRNSLPPLLGTFDQSSLKIFTNVYISLRPLINGIGNRSRS